MINAESRSISFYEQALLISLPQETATTAPPHRERPAVLERPLTPVEMADYLRISPRTLRTLMAEGKVPSFKVGNQARFMPSEVVAALQREDGGGKDGGK